MKGRRIPQFQPSTEVDPPLQHHQAAAKSTSSVPLLEVTQRGSSRAEQSLKRSVALARSWQRCPTEMGVSMRKTMDSYGFIMVYT